MKNTLQNNNQIGAPLHNSNNKDSNKERGYRILYYLFLIVTIIAAIAMFTSAYSYNRNDFAAYIDSVNNADIVYFDFGKYELKENSFDVLNKIAELLNENKNVTIEIIGYTDNIGSNSYNYNLSWQRAKSVMEYFLNKNIDEARIIITAKGESEPVNTNSSENERALNRRVIFNLYKDGKLITINELNIKPASNEDKENNSTVTYETINSQIKVNAREEITAELIIRDSAGIPIEGITEDDISAVLKWNISNKPDSTEGYPRMIPIDDKKKLAFTLTLDYSGSMYGIDKYVMNVAKSDKIKAMENAVKKFIDMMEPNMYCKLIMFGTIVESSMPFTNSKTLLHKTLNDKSYYRGGTALYLSIYEAISDTMFNSNPTVMKTVIALTDGMENSSKKITLDSIYKISSRFNTKVFTVGLFDDVGEYRPELHEIIRREEDMHNIARNTGGFFYLVNDFNKLDQVYSNIFNQILKSYNISIVWNSSNLPPKGTLVRVELKVNVPQGQRLFYKDYIME